MIKKKKKEIDLSNGIFYLLPGIQIKVFANEFS